MNGSIINQPPKLRLCTCLPPKMTLSGYATVVVFFSSLLVKSPRSAPVANNLRHKHEQKILITHTCGPSLPDLPGMPTEPFSPCRQQKGRAKLFLMIFKIDQGFMKDKSQMETICIYLRFFES